MPQDIRVKICGLRRVEDVRACATAGVAYIGLNFVAGSKRVVDVPTAVTLAQTAPVGMAKVALTLDASDAAIDAILSEVPIDIVQLHGNETPDRVAAVRDRTGLPVMKAVGLAGEGDLSALEDHMRAADMVLVDAKPPTDGALPGGNGLTFDWRLLQGRRWPVPWMLAGGLVAANVGEAIRLTGATQVDLASGVESAPGVKDAAMIAAFMDAARAA